MALSQPPLAIFCPKIGGDMAVVRGMVKVLIDLEEAAQQQGKAVF